MNKRLLYLLLKLSVFSSEILYHISFKYKQLNINLNKCNILFNRTDRIGDAIVTLPFFLALKKKGVRFKVLCSPYNKWVLEPFVSIQEIKDYNLLNYSPFRSIRSMFNVVPFLLAKFFSKKKNFHTLFIDLKGDLYLSERFKNSYEIHFKSVPLNLKYSDYVFDDFYVFGSKMHLLEKYSMIFDSLDLDIKEFPDELKEYISNNHNKEIDNLVNSLKDFIIIFVGNKEFRNLNIEQWKHLIENINYKGNILIIDDPSQNYLKKLKSIIKKENVMFLEKAYDLWSLMYLAMHSKLVVGIDGGGFNFLQMPTNAFEIIFYTNEKVWRPFSRNKYRVIRKYKNHVIEKSITSQNLKKYIYYVNWEYKVVYEVLQEKNNNFVNQLRLNLILEELNKILAEL